VNLGLEGRRALVTGSSRGIGLAVARALHAEGARVLLHGRDEDALAAAAAQLDGAATVAADITAPEAGERLRAAADDALGGIDILVNNAGTSRNAPPDELTDDDWQSQWELNVMAPMRLMREFAPGMAERGWGRIVNVASSAGKRPSQRNVAYAVTKAAELSLSRAFADAYAAKGVLINAVAPGPVGTELWLGEGGMADQTAAATGTPRAEVLEKLGAGIPRGRVATPEEIAAPIVFLCSEAAGNVAGAAWSVDGGTVPSIM
jgi:3-oxoacyl-[acyl-carrier protein] reductase